jgi:hypothetical protein
MPTPPDPEEVMNEARARVGNGMRWLQDDGPRFGFDILRIRIPGLNMKSGYECPLAQAHSSADYYVALSAVHGPLTTDDQEEKAEAWAALHGFQHGVCLSIEEPVPGYEHLRQAWIQALELDGSERS